VSSREVIESSSPAASKVMRGNRRRDTAPELALRSELHRRGRRFRVDYRISVPGFPARPDVVFPRQRVAVYVDGCFWHRCPVHGTEPKTNSRYWMPKLNANVARDRRMTTALEREGWRVLRLWAHTPPSEAADAVDAALGQAAN